MTPKEALTTTAESQIGCKASKGNINKYAEVVKITNEDIAEMLEITKAVEDITVALTQLTERLARGE